MKTMLNVSGNLTKKKLTHAPLRMCSMEVNAGLKATRMKLTANRLLLKERNGASQRKTVVNALGKLTKKLVYPTTPLMNTFMDQNTSERL